MTARSIAAKAASNYCRRCWWAEHSDLENTAMVAVLEAERTWDPEVGVPKGAYQWRAAVLALRNYLWETSSPVSLPKRSAMLPELAKGISKVALDPSAGTTTPWPDRLIDDDRWRQGVRAQLEALTDHDQDADLALAVLLGEGRSAEVAQARGVPVQRVYRATQRVRELMRVDLTLYELWQDLDG